MTLQLGKKEEDVTLRDIVALIENQTQTSIEINKTIREN